MAASIKHSQIFSIIVSTLEKGFYINEKTCHFIHSMVSVSSILELKQLLEDTNNCETDTLLEFIFFPDKDLQLKLEPLLQIQPFTKVDETLLQRQLIERQLVTKLHVYNLGTIEQLHLPDWILATFISRLNLCNCISTKLNQTIEDYIHQHLKSQLRVTLRNKPLLLSKHKIDFLCTFCKKTVTYTINLIPLFEYLLDFLTEISSNADIFDALAKKKQAYILNLQRASQFETLKRQHNVETLMLQGVRFATIDRKVYQSKIEIVDLICQIVFGKTTNMLKEPVNVSLDLCNLEDLFTQISD